MEIILICWAVGAIVGLLWGIAKNTRNAPEKEEGAGVPDHRTVAILQDCFKSLSPNSRGAGSLDYLNLSTLIRKMEAGEAVPEGLAAYLLGRIEGAEPWAEKLKTGEGV